MSYKIKWTTIAQKDYYEILTYLKENFGQTVSEKFSLKIEKELSLISQMPKMFPLTELIENLRRAVVVKQVSMYYLEVEVKKEVVIIRLYDNRRNPAEISKEILEEVESWEK
jgi:plasmid stabilization system protein ParE